MWYGGSSCRATSMIPAIMPAPDQAATSTEIMEHHQYARPQFRLLFAALVVSMVGDSSMMLVPPIAMRDLTGSAGAAGLTVLFFMLPICAAPAFGWAIDRLARRSV